MPWLRKWLEPSWGLLGNFTRYLRTKGTDWELKSLLGTAKAAAAVAGAVKAARQPRQPRRRWRVALQSSLRWSSLDRIVGKHHAHLGAT